MTETSAKWAPATALQTLGSSKQFNHGLIRYGLAASALGAISISAQAAEQAYAPPEGLPVTITNSNGPFDVDIDNDMEADFVIFRETDYGGGFGIGTYTNSDAFDSNKVRSHRYNLAQYLYGTWAVRLEPGSVINKYDYSYQNGLYHYGNTTPGNSSMLIDIKGNISRHRPFQPFRNKPGFIGLILGPTINDDYSTNRIAWLEVVVSPDGSELKILSGGYEDNLNVYDKILPDFTPPPAALTTLAAGAE
jgi:hypothetical protein